MSGMPDRSEFAFSLGEQPPIPGPPSKCVSPDVPWAAGTVTTLGYPATGTRGRPSESQIKLPSSFHVRRCRSLKLRRGRGHTMGMLTRTRRLGRGQCRVVWRLGGAVRPASGPASRSIPPQDPLPTIGRACRTLLIRICPLPTTAGGRPPWLPLARPAADYGF